ncbi:MAG: 16S rRNA (cytidine(1402)-2'-O)-methyltransferase [Candidatus Uhrbacteria bacterium]
MKLYIVATPIGNLKDVSERMLETLRSVDLILCEDTRVTAKLLAKYGIEKPLQSYHQHSDQKKVEKILDELSDDKNLALVTDAGTPGISDPGSMLVAETLRRFEDQIEIIPIPGPSAVTTALSISGFPADEFIFLGFPPHKKGRQKYFDRLSEIKSTIVLYESTHRILKTMDELNKRIKDRPIAVGRELTKLHETIYRGTTSEVTDELKTGSIKGEFVIVISPTK